jgi:hypothetical protein
MLAGESHATAQRLGMASLAREAEALCTALR